MNKKILVLLIFSFAIISLSCVNALDSVDSGQKMEINSIKFIIPNDFQEVTSEREVGDDYVKVLYTDGEDNLNIFVMNAPQVNSIDDVNWAKYIENPFKITKANKEGISSYHYYPLDVFAYVENGKIIEISLPMVSTTHGTSDEFLEEIIYQGDI